MIVEDTNTLLRCFLNGASIHSGCYAVTGGKKRYATVEEVAPDSFTVAIFGNVVIESTATRLRLNKHGHQTPATREALLAFTTITSLGVANTAGRWTIEYDGGRRLWPQTQVLDIHDNEQWIAAKDLREGDLVDLEPTINILGLCAFGKCSECDSRISMIENELQEVAVTETETPTCTVVHFDFGSYGMPPDLMLCVHQRGSNVPITVREHMERAPEVEVDTPFGPVWLTAVTADSILVDANSNGRRIIVNKVPVSFLHHWFLQADGSWTSISGTASPSPLMISRRDRIGQLASNACYRKVQETIPTVVQEWASSPIGKHWLDHAQRAWVNNEARQLEQDIVDTAATLQTKQQQLATLLGRDVADIEEELRG